jgi:hypothetical protein
MEFSQHAFEGGETFLDLNLGGSRAGLFEFQDCPWVAVLTPDDATVITL